MSWHFTDDVNVFATRTWDLLATRPTENTVALTMIESVRGGRRWSPEPMRFGWYEVGGRVLGAVALTPPYDWLLAEVPSFALTELVAALHVEEAPVVGVSGDVVTVDALAAEWTEAGRLEAATISGQRLYRLEELRAPDPHPAGKARRSDLGDVALLVDWWARFQEEAQLPVLDSEPVIRSRIDAGLLWQWEDASGQVVSHAGRNATSAGVARVGPVYTPPEHRRRGYGAAVTAACTQDALDCGAREVVLFTDLANPTSNAIYQQIGYVPVRDQKIVRFTPTS